MGMAQDAGPFFAAFNTGLAERRRHHVKHKSGSLDVKFVANRRTVRAVMPGEEVSWFVNFQATGCFHKPEAPVKETVSFAGASGLCESSIRNPASRPSVALLWNRHCLKRNAPAILRWILSARFLVSAVIRGKEPDGHSSFRLDHALAPSGSFGTDAATAVHGESPPSDLDPSSLHHCRELSHVGGNGSTCAAAGMLRPR